MGIAGGPDIIQNGLALALDAADRNSYPGSGTVWGDVSGNNYNFTLTNSPTFSNIKVLDVSTLIKQVIMLYTLEIYNII